MPITYLNRIAGRTKQVLASIASAGAADAFKLVATGANGKLDPTLMPDGIGADALVMTASEAINAGAIVNIHAGGVRNADADAEGREAHGFVNAAIANGATGTVYFEGVISGLAALTRGSRYYMSEAAGAVTLVPVAGAGKVDQAIGVAISTTEISFEIGMPITLAA